MKTVACKYTYVQGVGYYGPMSPEGWARNLPKDYHHTYAGILGQNLLACAHGPVVTVTRNRHERFKTATWYSDERVAWDTIEPQEHWHEFLRSQPFPVEEPAWVTVVDYRERLVVISRRRKEEGSQRIRALFLGDGPGYLVGDGMEPTHVKAWWGVEDRVSYIPPIVHLETEKDITI